MQIKEQRKSFRFAFLVDIGTRSQVALQKVPRNPLEVTSSIHTCSSYYFPHEILFILWGACKFQQPVGVLFVWLCFRRASLPGHWQKKMSCLHDKIHISMLILLLIEKKKSIRIIIQRIEGNGNPAISLHISQVASFRVICFVNVQLQLLRDTCKKLFWKNISTLCLYSHT